MAITEQLLALGKAYPIITVAIAGVLFFIGLRAAKFLKKIFFGLAIIALIAAIIMIFYI
jgi:hypothetical protein